MWSFRVKRNQAKYSQNLNELDVVDAPIFLEAEVVRKTSEFLSRQENPSIRQELLELILLQKARSVQVSFLLFQSLSAHTKTLRHFHKADTKNFPASL